jgi:hypothetical protein
MGVGRGFQEEMLRQIAEVERISEEHEERRDRILEEGQRRERSSCSKQIQAVNEEGLGLTDRSEGQLLEDIDTGRTNVSFRPAFRRWDACPASPSNDDPPTNQVTRQNTCRNRNGQDTVDLSQGNLDEVDTEQVLKEMEGETTQDCRDAGDDWGISMLTQEWLRDPRELLWELDKELQLIKEEADFTWRPRIQEILEKI